MQKTIALLTIAAGALLMGLGWFRYDPEAQVQTWAPLFIGGFVVALIGGIAKAGAEMSQSR